MLAIETLADGITKCGRLYAGERENVHVVRRDAECNWRDGATVSQARARLVILILSAPARFMPLVPGGRGGRIAGIRV
jgi:hypothetical protein